MSNENSQVFDFSDAPGGDLNLDEIFGESSPTPTTTTVVPQDPPAPTVVTTPSTEPVIKTKTGTVYKTLDDAVQGIEHKDALIAQLREQVRNDTGVDPLSSRRPVTPPVAGPKSYIDDQNKYFEDIAKAVADKDTKAYMDAQQKLIWDSLGPLAPTITALSKANAERVVTQEIPEFRDFVNSDQYARLNEHSPLLADAIRAAEASPQAANQLPELYRIAYLSTQGRRIPEIIQSVRSESPQVQPRPTVHSTPTPPPSTNVGTPPAPPSLDNSEGRKAIIKQMEAGGIANQRW